MKTAGIVFPNQLLKETAFLNNAATVFIVEEHLFFNQYKFHKRKLAFHRASMKSYAEYLKTMGYDDIRYISAQEEGSDIRKLLPNIKKEGFEVLFYMDTIDNYLSKRIIEFASGLKLSMSSTELFINSTSENAAFFIGKKKMFQTEFYIYQRKKLGILIDENEKPTGGNWTYDIDNRKKYPSKKTAPYVGFPEENKYTLEAKEYVESHFYENYGTLEYPFLYPIDHASSELWLDNFLETRFQEFGDYEDAIHKTEIILHHSLLSPLINCGLLTVELVISKSLEYFNENKAPLNSAEGFVRQIIGWREFIRAVYELKGTKERTTNFWKFKRKIPASFYSGTTGIEPVDDTIKKVLKTGYCHHIERLMILGNFMLLCEFDPDEVYKWFMEMFIDAYDWVMVPNVYGMSQFADGGLMSTKPYFSGSNYIMKMSNYKKGPWQEVWDALFWRFMHTHRDFLKKNPRLNMLVSTFDKMESQKRTKLLEISKKYLAELEQQKQAS